MCPRAPLPVCRGGYGAGDSPTAEWREEGLGLVHIMPKRDDREMGDKEKAAGGPPLSRKKETAGRGVKLCDRTGLG